MTEWLAQYWYVVIGVVGAATCIGVRMYRREGSESFGTRLLYTIAPVLDPNSEERKSLTPRALVLFAIGLLIVGLLILFVPGFSS